MGKRLNSRCEIVKPYLKYVGGKSRLLPQLLPHIPAGQRFIEPFMGSCAVSLAVANQFDMLLLSDICRPVVLCHESVCQHSAKVQQYLQRLYEHHSDDFYYRVRENFNTRPDDWRKAAQLIYLNRHGFNGLTRFNRSGQYNVPVGKYKSVYFPEDELRAFAKQLKNATFTHCAFEVALSKAGRGDVVYCDPPYVPYAERSAVQYAGRDFDQNMQVNLARHAEQAARRGATVLISNHLTDFTRRQYRSADKHVVFNVSRSVSCSSESRTQVEEILAIWRPI